jgi:hypothetical protein
MTAILAMGQTERFACHAGLAHERWDGAGERADRRAKGGKDQHHGGAGCGQKTGEAHDRPLWQNQGLRNLGTGFAMTGSSKECGNEEIMFLYGAGASRFD